MGFFISLLRGFLPTVCSTGYAVKPNIPYGIKLQHVMSSVVQCSYNPALKLTSPVHQHHQFI